MSALLGCERVGIWSRMIRLLGQQCQQVFIAVNLGQGLGPIPGATDPDLILTDCRHYSVDKYDSMLGLSSCLVHLVRHGQAQRVAHCVGGGGGGGGDGLAVSW